MKNERMEQMLSVVLETVEKLQIFTLEEFEFELLSIPNDTIKEQCIEWILTAPEMDHVFDIYFFNSYVHGTYAQH